MEITTSEQCAAAFSIVNYYHADVVTALRSMIDEPQTESELEIVSGLLRGSLRHMLDEAQKRITQKTAT